jgi:hypothetical protein
LGISQNPIKRRKKINQKASNIAIRERKCKPEGKHK